MTGKGSHGRIAKLIGDGVLVEFPSAVSAVRCAVELQQRVGKATAIGTTDGCRCQLKIATRASSALVRVMSPR
jgi:class 3 adenylate cyclase